MRADCAPFAACCACGSVLPPAHSQPPAPPTNQPPNQLLIHPSHPEHPPHCAPSSTCPLCWTPCWATTRATTRTRGERGSVLGCVLFHLAGGRARRAGSHAASAAWLMPPALDAPCLCSHSSFLAATPRCSRCLRSSSAGCARRWRRRWVFVVEGEEQEEGALGEALGAVHSLTNTRSPGPPLTQVPMIFGAVFECTLGMITRNFEARRCARRAALRTLRSRFTLACPLAPRRALCRIPANPFPSAPTRPLNPPLPQLAGLPGAPPAVLLAAACHHQPLLRHALRHEPGALAGWGWQGSGRTAPPAPGWLAWQQGTRVRGPASAGACHNLPCGQAAPAPLLACRWPLPDLHHPHPRTPPPGSPRRRSSSW